VLSTRHYEGTIFEEICCFKNIYIYIHISSIAPSEIFFIVQIFEWVVIINVGKSFEQYVILFKDFKHT
jgi:hypothetical protein